MRILFMMLFQSLNLDNNYQAISSKSGLVGFRQAQAVPLSNLNSSPDSALNLNSRNVKLLLVLFLVSFNIVTSDPTNF